MVGWILNLGYALALLASSPVWLARMVRYGKYRRDWSQRLGKAPKRYGLQPVIWIHGVSVGEVSAARQLVAQLHEQLPDFRVAVSSTTDTGVAAARRLFAPDHQVFRWPADFTFTVARALDRLAPSMVILMEGDVWPNFVRTCRRRDIPVVVVNGRIGPHKGYPRYKRIRPLAAGLFNSLTAIGVQHEAYADLYRALGVRNDKLHVTGMVKYDTADLGDRVAGQEELAAAVGLKAGEKLLVAGGTGAGEEKIVLEAYRRLLESLPGAGETPAARAGKMPATRTPKTPVAPVRLAIVPRKPERFNEVAELIAREGFGLIRRSERPNGWAPDPPGAGRPAIPDCFPTPNGPRSVILGDTMGELRKFYALASAVFVGRSLVPEGGSDIIEAAGLGKAVCFGYHTFNFPQAETMVGAGAARRVADVEELATVWREWLKDEPAAAEIGHRAREFVRAQRGATRRNVEMICRIIGRVPAAVEGGIATDAIEEPV